jgi:hypothetical protein
MINRELLYLLRDSLSSAEEREWYCTAHRIDTLDPRDSKFIVMVIWVPPCELGERILDLHSICHVIKVQALDLLQKMEDFMSWQAFMGWMVRSMVVDVEDRGVLGRYRIHHSSPDLQVELSKRRGHGVLYACQQRRAVN